MASIAKALTRRVFRAPNYATKDIRFRQTFNGDAVVSNICKSVGDTIGANDTVVQLETRKLVIDVWMPTPAKLVQLHVKIGDEIDDGQKLFTVDTE